MKKSLELGIHFSLTTITLDTGALGSSDEG